MQAVPTTQLVLAGGLASEMRATSCVRVLTMSACRAISFDSSNELGQVALGWVRQRSLEVRPHRLNRLQLVRVRRHLADGRLVAGGDQLTRGGAGVGVQVVVLCPYRHSTTYGGPVIMPRVGARVVKALVVGVGGLARSA